MILASIQIHISTTTNKMNTNTNININININTTNETDKIISCHSELFLVDYHVKIHDCQTCRCRQMIQIVKNEEKNINPDEIITHVIAKLFDDENIKSRPRYIFITQREKDFSKELSCRFIESMLFDKKFILDYFRSYKWSPMDAAIVRQETSNMAAACYCRNDAYHKNTGIIIFGTKHQMEQIANIFNEYVTATEFAKLYVINLNRPNNGNDSGEFQGNKFVDSDIFEKIRKMNLDQYTVIGLQSSRYIKEPKMNFSFGKPEWTSNDRETTFHCAKRELFEEFNVQISQRILSKSRLNNDIPNTIDTGYGCHFLISIKSGKITYDENSETIYIE